jgi:hypothetical protein
VYNGYIESKNKGNKMSESKLKSLIAELIESYADALALDEDAYADLLMNVSEMLSEMSPA